MEVILINILKSDIILQNYTFKESIVRKLSYPTKINEYSFFFFSKEAEREIDIKLLDYFSYQKIIVWIRNIGDLETEKIDIEQYYISFLKLNKTKHVLVFKSNTEKQLEFNMKKIFQYLTNNGNDNIKAVLSGNAWINMPYDWEPYK